MTSTELAASKQQGERVRGLSRADALAVVFIAAVVGAFLDPQGLVGYLLIAAMAGVYATIRVTRGWPLRRRLVAVAAVFAVPLTFAGVLDRLGY